MSMSLIGLVRHMTEMERVCGHRLADWAISWLYFSEENEAGDFEAVTAAGGAADLDTFRALRPDQADHGGSPTRRHLRQDEAVHVALVVPVPD